MSFFSSFSLPSFTPTDPVAAAKAKVEKAEKDLADAKAELEKVQSTPANTSDGVGASVSKVGGRKRTYRNKEKRPAKRRRNGRRSIRS
jgi:hypothetical protein